ncbi:sigma-70 family RNA polymerase sigma factor, partial [Streptomyces hundungensis]|uniref:sigma-70 family RNA polymerase sigma factor n=1 Tax=Streptomyces hundungensis TaxID=1077946 RepID=UPI003F53EE1A
MDGALRPGRQGRLHRGRGPHGLHQPVQTARRGTRTGVSGEGPVRDGERIPEAARPAGIPEQQARPHPEDSPVDGPNGVLYAAEQAERAALMSEHSEHSEHRHHDPHDRSGARAMFIELRKMSDGSSEKAELRNQLVRMHLPLVEHLARRFRNRGEPLDDLTQVATIGLIKSVDRFDPERGVEFSTYATPTVVGEIKRHFRDKG